MDKFKKYEKPAAKIPEDTNKSKSIGTNPPKNELNMVEKIVNELNDAKYAELT